MSFFARVRARARKTETVYGGERGRAKEREREEEEKEAHAVVFRVCSWKSRARLTLPPHRRIYILQKNRFHRAATCIIEPLQRVNRPTDVFFGRFCVCIGITCAPICPFVFALA